MTNPTDEDDAERLISPCINVCVLDDRQEYCRGCWRTMSEIGQWSQLTTDQKRDVLEICNRRQRNS